MLNKKLISAVAGLATVASLAIAGPAAFAANSLTAGGSSFAGGLIKDCATSWTHNGDSVTYTSNSSGTGRTNFNGGSYDFGAADAPYGSSDNKPSDLVYVPLVAGPVAIAFNVPGVSTLNLTPAVFGKILDGSITKWNDTAIKAINKSAKLANKDIVVVYRNTTSGTNQNVAKYLSQTTTGWTENSSFATAGGATGGNAVGKAASVDVVNYIAANDYTIGYADLKDTLNASLRFAALRNGHGQFVKPTVATAGKFLKNQAGNVGQNGLVSFDYTADVAGAYNLDLVTYGLAHNTTAGHSNGASVKAFFSYVINSCAPARAATLGYLALPGAIKSKALALVRTVK